MKGYDMGKDRILLFIPAYNCENQITRVLYQLDAGMTDYIEEVIVINNRSTDNGEQAVEEYLREHELLIALAITAKTNEHAAAAMAQLPHMKGSEAHSTVILPEEDANVFRKLGVNVTFDPVYQHKKLYHPK